jgi:predicted transcriptional regulator
MRYRSRIELMSQILEAVNGDDHATKTRIMYKASLSHVQLKEYLSILTENDFLDYDFDTRTYKTTGRGHMFLEIYNQLGVMVNGEQLQHLLQQL